MTQRKTARVEHLSESVMAARLQQLKALFPEAFHEDGVDFDALRALLGLEGGAAKERYSFTWAGKQDALLSLQTRSTAALKPDPSESVNWDSTQNLFIEGDNLEVLKLLYKSYYGRVKMIYIDPPYNTENDFIYPDDYTDSMGNYLRVTEQVDDDGLAKSSKLEISGRKHSKWLSMMYPRLFVARQLLREDGVIFISIDDHEVHNLRLLMNEIFGEENFLGIACRVAKKSNNKGDYWSPNFDFVLTYGRNIDTAKPFSGGINESSYNLVEESGSRAGEKYQLIRLYMSNIENRNPEQRYFIECPDGSKVIPPGTTFPPERPNLGDGIWRWTRKTFEENRDKIVIKEARSSNLVDENGNSTKWNVYVKTYLKDVIENNTAKPNSLIENYINQQGTEEIKSLGIPFEYPKTSGLIKYLMEISQIRDDDIILDFFAGSATTADAVLQLNREDGGNRRFILVQLPEITSNPEYPTIADISRERIRRAIKRMEAEAAGKLDGFEARPDEDLGFRAFKLDHSPMRQWEDLPPDTSPEEYTRQLELFVNEPLLDGWTVQEVIAEVALKEVGFSLSYRADVVASVQGQTVYRVSDDDRNQHFYICLDDRLDWEALQPLARALTHADLFVFRDSAVTDTVVANLSLTCRIKSL
jgi:adenine-specific DNA-methyltransferase